MIIPIRCFTCGKPIAHLYDEYMKLIQKDYYKNDSKDLKRFYEIDDMNNSKNITLECNALNQLDCTRYCCRRMLLSSIDMTEDI
jgi:DNA-directed RNA polymerase subunit N (RpoN/RPB10)